MVSSEILCCQPHTQPTDYSSLVTLNPDHISVTAVAVTYSSSIPLKVVDEGLDHTITEYLCGTFLDAIFNSSNQLRLHWMQRYGMQSAINHSAWTMDDVTIKFWNGSCYMDIYLEDFNMQPSSNEGSIDIIAGSIIEPPFHQVQVPPFTLMSLSVIS